jgi:flagellin
MIVQHNMQAINTNRQLGITTGNLSKSTEKLASGYRINRASDDAAGLAISEKMRGQIRGLEQASRNAADGISLIQTAEGALNEIHSIVQRMRELTVQAANDTNVTKDRQAIAAEIYALTSEITRIGEETEFNTMKLLDGTFTGKKLQVGANEAQQISITIVPMTATGIGLTDAAVGSVIYAADNTNDADEITAILSLMDKALEAVSTQRSALGAIQNRLEHTIANADNVAENLTASESRIRDVDMAEEMVQFSKNNILQQAGQSMLAQANQSTQGVLSLLQ